MSNQYETHFRRLARASDFEHYADTGVQCEYTNHRGEHHAVIRVAVDVSACCNKEENKEVTLCWDCANFGYHDQFYCRCKQENNMHESKDLTFKGEIVKVKSKSK